MTQDFTCVITTIQPPTASVRVLVERLAAVGSQLLVIGDKKGPARFDLPAASTHPVTRVNFLSLDAQMALPFDLARQLPTGHYARKNLGYLLAISRGAPCIYETDDDNAPGEHWAVAAAEVEARAVSRPRKAGGMDGSTDSVVWFNAYRLFTDQLIWPRGLPLDAVRAPAPSADASASPSAGFRCPIQQGLADLSPDVDAVWRLILDRPFFFDRRPSVWLAPGVWCPFNSQNTWWWPEAYPLLYLPSYCTFRMTDIWRSFVAQRCLWELGCGLAFHSADVVQERNVHNLMRDFKDEVPGYEHNAAIARNLSELALRPGPGAVADNLLACYGRLVEGGFFPEKELDLLRSWVQALDART